jgi:hypothetical protein
MWFLHHSSLSKSLVRFRATIGWLALKEHEPCRPGGTFMGDLIGGFAFQKCQMRTRVNLY